MENKRIELVQMTLARSGTWGQQYRRPYNTDGQGHVIEQFQTRFDQMGPDSQGNKATANNLFAGIANQFLRPQSNPESEVGIANSWSTERFYFVLEVKISSPMGECTELIQGYTNYVDVSYSGEIDPRMEFYINSVTTVKSIMMNKGFGMVMTPSVAHSYHVLANSDYAGPHSTLPGAPNSNISLRPQDVIGSIQTQPGDSSGLFRPEDAGQISDLRSAMSKVTKVSLRENGLASNYTSRMINGYALAAQGSLDTTRGSLLSNTYTAVAPTISFSSDQFVCALSNINNRPKTNTFTYQELLNIDRSFDSRVSKILDLALMKVAGQYTVDISQQNFAGWGGSDMETIAATILSNGLPAMMSEFNVRHIVFHASNYSGQPFINISFANPIAEGLTLTSIQMSALEHRIMSDLLHDISMQNQISYDITGSVHLTRPSNLTIQFNGGETVMFATPTFADALTTPVITNNHGRMNEVAQDFENLLDCLVQVRDPDLDSFVMPNMDYSTL